MLYIILVEFPQKDANFSFVNSAYCHVCLCWHILGYAYNLTTDFKNPSVIPYNKHFAPVKLNPSLNEVTFIVSLAFAITFISLVGPWFWCRDLAFVIRGRQKFVAIPCVCRNDASCAWNRAPFCLTKLSLSRKW